MTKGKKESNTLIGQRIKLPFGYWKIVKETPEGVILTNRKDHRKPLTFAELARFSGELRSEEPESC